MESTEEASGKDMASYRRMCNVLHCMWQVCNVELAAAEGRQLRWCGSGRIPADT